MTACVNDADCMRTIADNLGYSSTLLLNEEATADRVITEIGRAARSLDQDGILLLTYSGHGGQMPDADGDEDDGQDETWVLYERQLIDDEPGTTCGTSSGAAASWCCRTAATAAA